MPAAACLGRVFSIDRSAPLPPPRRFLQYTVLRVPYAAARSKKNRDARASAAAVSQSRTRPLRHHFQPTNCTP